jgi:hypothetical protein
MDNADGLHDVGGGYPMEVSALVKDGRAAV